MRVVVVAELRKRAKGLVRVAMWLPTSRKTADAGGVYVLVLKTSLLDQLQMLPDLTEIDVRIEQGEGQEPVIYLGGPSS